MTMRYPNDTHASAHLAWVELACRDVARTPYPPAWRLSRGVPLAVEFERIRAIVGLPIRIGSAYRTPDHNRAVGGAAGSQHVQGRALDLYPPASWTLEQFYRVVHAVAIEPRTAVYGLGRYPTFVHLDIRPPRPDGRLTCWRGSRAWAEVKNGDPLA